jgi:hypothetical protein
MGSALVVSAALPVAIHEVRAEALLWSALLVLPALDEGVESTTTLGHVDVQPLHFMAARDMPMPQAFALVGHSMAFFQSRLVTGNTITEAIPCEAIHVLLVLLVRILEGLLDVEDKHGTNGLQGVFDVLVELPTRL